MLLFLITPAMEQRIDCVNSRNKIARKQMLGMGSKREENDVKSV